MNALTSPLKNGDAYPPPPDRYRMWGPAGRVAWYLRRLVAPGDPYLDSLKRQMDQRGAVSPGAWSTPRRQEIAEEIIAILATACWDEELSFHPEDPWSIVGKCEVGDMCEVDAIYRIEAKFKLNRCDVLWRKVRDGLTFGEVVAYIEQHEGDEDRHPYLRTRPSKRKPTA